MKDGFKIADVDTHLMEPDYVFERYIDERYKSAAPKMGIAPESGRRTFLVEGEPFTREKGKYPMAAPGENHWRSKCQRKIFSADPATEPSRSITIAAL